MKQDTLTCAPGPAMGRVLPARHRVTHDDDWPCPGCLPCPADHCSQCRVTHSTGACPSCLNTIKTSLSVVYALTVNLHIEVAHGRCAFTLQDGMPGGQAMVMLAPGADAHAYASQLAYRISNGLDVSHVQEEHPNDPRPPLAVLADWVDTWRRDTGRPAAMMPTLHSTVHHLRDHLHEHAGDPALGRFSDDVVQLQRALEDVLREGERSQATRVPCLLCDARLVKVYGETEDDDHYVCPQCHQRYDQGRYNRAKHDHLASAGADRYVLVADASDAIQRSQATVRAWVAAGRVQTTRHPTSRRLLVWWPDVRGVHLVTPRRRRG